MKNNISSITTIETILEEIRFEYEHEHNRALYIIDKESITDSLKYTDDDWNELTNKLIRIEHTLLKMSNSHLHGYLNSCIVNDGLKKREEEFLKSSAYGYMAYTYAKVINGCLESKKIDSLDVNASLAFPDLARILAQCQIAEWWDKSENIGTDILADINNYNTGALEITGTGYSINPISWFVIDLYTLSTDGWYIEKNAKHTPKKKYKLWQNVLDNWNSTDMSDIEKMVFILCEAHLVEHHNKAIFDREMDNILGASIENAISIITYMSTHSAQEDFMPRDLDDMSVKLFPYEVFAFLSVREKAGLKNPKHFSHPLMNTILTKNLKIKNNSIPKLEYIEYILEGFMEECPNVEIPQWLDNTTETTSNTTEKQDDILPDDFFKKE